METKKLSEKESLELITTMINATKRNMEVGSGNIFLCYGYFTTILAFVLFLLVYFTGHLYWNVGWFLMFIFWGIMSFPSKRRGGDKVTSYIDKAIAQVWQVTGWMFVLTVVVMALVGYWYERIDFTYMLPLSLLYCAIATSITGVIIRDKWTAALPLVGVVVALYILLTLQLDSSIIGYWNLLFGCSFILMMIIPGHILNYKAKKSC